MRGPYVIYCICEKQMYNCIWSIHNLLDKTYKYRNFCWNYTPHTLYCIEKWINGLNAAWSRSVMRKGMRYEARRMNGRRRRIPQTLAPGWITYPQTHTAVTGPFCTITCCYSCPLARSPRVRSVTTTPAGALTCTHPLTSRFLLLLETANRD